MASRSAGGQLDRRGLAAAWRGQPASAQLCARRADGLSVSDHDSVSDRGRYKILDIVVGDPKAGQAFFNGAGKCSTCHSPEGDLKGIASRYEDAVTLQGRIVMPRGGRRRRRNAPANGHPDLPPFLEETAPILRPAARTAASRKRAA